MASNTWNRGRCSAIELDLVALRAVMNCDGTGIRQYALAGSLDIATDFRNLDLRGWPLGNQDLRGFDLSGCDLRSTGVEHALTDHTTNLDGTRRDDVAEKNADLRRYDNRRNLLHCHTWITELETCNNNEVIFTFGKNILPMLESRYGRDDQTLIDIKSAVATAETNIGLITRGINRFNEIWDQISDNDSHRKNLFTIVSWRNILALDYSGRHNDALVLCNNVIKEISKFNYTKMIWYILSRRAVFMSMMGDYNAAAREINALIQSKRYVYSKSDNFLLFYFLAVIEQNGGRKELALEAIRQARTFADHLEPSKQWFLPVLESLDCGIRMNDKCSLEEVTRIRLAYETLAADTGTRSRHSVRTRYRLAKALFLTGDVSEAAKESDAALIDLGVEIDPNSLLLRSLAQLKDVIAGGQLSEPLFV